MEKPYKIDDNDQDYQEEEEERKVYNISNLLTFFKKNRIDPKMLIVYERRVIMILVSYETTSVELCIYIPSKYEVKADRTTGIPMYEVVEDDEPDTQDSLFVNQIGFQNMKIQKQCYLKMLSRFIPLFDRSKIKLMYIASSFLTFITRNNDMDGYVFNVPCSTTGYYYIIDLENFYKMANDIHHEVKRCDDLLNSNVYTRCQNILDTELNMLEETIADIKMTTAIDRKRKYDTRMKLLEEVGMKSPDKKEVSKEICNEVRKDNFKQLFKIENLSYLLNDLKNLN
jgi:hypothetical protein